VAHSVRPIRRLLIANRGEIAVRIARAARERGIETIAVCSEADVGAFHTRVCDRVVVLGPAKASDSYLRGDRIIAAAKEHGADAIHPGYGFLSQNADFADQVAAAGLIFVGPSGAAMRIMGDKTSARAAMQKAGVPIVPGFQGDGRESVERLSAEAMKIGFPLLVKAAAGGGGRGMRIVRAATELKDAIEGASRESEKAFGDGRLFLERYLEGAHHVEIQVLADHLGGAIHLGERECSVQRRYQKIVEEAPSPFIDDALRERMGQAAVAAAKACGYANAGTIEFLVDANKDFYFLEMNTRLQVEHPVTELVTGLDLVGLQLHVAEGRPLPLAQNDVQRRGHAIEVRMNAEDPGAGFVPSSGKVLFAHLPMGPGIRIDAGYEAGDVVSTHYDSLMAKLLVHASDRTHAIARMQALLDEATVLGVATNLEFVQGVLAHDVFRAGAATTTFVDEHMTGWKPNEPSSLDEALIALIVAEAEAGSGGAGGSSAGGGQAAKRHDPFDQADGFRSGGG
jgi:acetyl-CoA carboxylase biotin carboxylase subunit